ncbi:MAG: hypothetical protein ACK559_05055, partial [bacterium]
MSATVDEGADLDVALGVAGDRRKRDLDLDARRDDAGGLDVGAARDAGDVRVVEPVAEADARRVLVTEVGDRAREARAARAEVATGARAARGERRAVHV